MGSSKFIDFRVFGDITPVRSHNASHQSVIFRTAMKTAEGVSQVLSTSTNRQATQSTRCHYSGGRKPTRLASRLIALTHSVKVEEEWLKL